MSQESVELVRRSLELYNALGETSDTFVDPEEVAPEVWSRLAPDVELHERADLPDAKVYRGRAQAKEFWRKTQQLFSEIRWEPREFVDLGHAVLVETTVVAVGRGSDVRVEMEETDVFWFRDGLIVRVQGYATKDEALAVVGV
jgi:ketosteroid isomerase-like protein